MSNQDFPKASCVTQKPGNSLPPVIIELNGLIPPKKNSKMLIRKSRNGKPALITKPEYAKRLAQVVDDLELKLLFACQTELGATLTGSSLRSWIVSSLPGDDCWTEVPEIMIKGELCAAGSEGATITIQRLT